VMTVPTSSTAISGFVEVSIGWRFKFLRDPRLL
jgi:hypothetical protein